MNKKQIELRDNNTVLLDKQLDIIIQQINDKLFDGNDFMNLKNITNLLNLAYSLEYRSKNVEFICNYIIKLKDDILGNEYTKEMRSKYIYLIKSNTTSKQIMNWDSYIFLIFNNAMLDNRKFYVDKDESYPHTLAWEKAHNYMKAIYKGNACGIVCIQKNDEDLGTFNNIKHWFEIDDFYGSSLVSRFSEEKQ